MTMFSDFSLVLDQICFEGLGMELRRNINESPMIRDKQKTRYAIIMDNLDAVP